MNARRRSARRVTLARIDPALLRQLGKFGGVGLAATLIHATLFATLVAMSITTAHTANLIAFSVAFMLSFFGHSTITFETRPSIKILLRFVIVALFGLAMNALVVEVITGKLAVDYRWCLPFMIFVVPAITFILSRQWAFMGAK